LILVSCGAGILLWTLGFVLHVRAVDAGKDFIGSYYASQCLLHGIDPYDAKNVLATLRAEGGEHPMDDELTREITSRYLYPPSAFAEMIPLALLPWGAAKVVWAVGSACCLIVAGFLVLDLCADEAAVVGGVFIGYLLGSSYVLVVLSNPSELAIGLAIIAAWCFIREKHGWAGVLCLAASLAIKPQIAGLVWLYFAVDGAMSRRRALLTLLAAGLVSLPFVAWVWLVSPNWNAELRTNVQAFSIRGGATDPGPSSQTANDMVDLQVLVSRVWDEPEVYNGITYLVVAPLIAWVAIASRRGGWQGSALYGLGAMAPLSLLPIYHHVYDAKLLLLTVPVLTLLWAKRDRTAWAALLLTGSAFLLAGDTTHHLLMDLAVDLRGGAAASGWGVEYAAVCAAPVSLLGTGIFYAWVFWKARGERRA
jgi:hypothetical protein